MVLIKSCLLLCVVLLEVNGHGRLLEPAGRSTLWRFGKSNAKNYNDNQLFCGGFGNQYFRNGGKCGICGDPYQGPRDNEAGGKYALGIIARHYNVGSQIDVTIEVTVNHYGYFEFKICPNNDVKKAATQGCLDRHLLSLTNGSTRYYLTQNIVGKYNIRLQLPKDITCSQCVFQWRWHGGNNWGRDTATGRSCLGCGPQEEFYGCADVSIGQTSSSGMTHQNQASGLPPQKPIGNVIGQLWSKSTRVPTIPPNHGGLGIFKTTRSPTKTPYLGGFGIFRPGIDLLKQRTTTQAPKQHRSCHGINNWAGQPFFDRWCTDQCGQGNCPSNACACS